MRAALEEVHLVPKAALAQHVTVIGDDDDHGVVAEIGVPEVTEHRPDLIVHVGDGSVVGMPCCPCLGLGHLLQVQPADVPQPF